MDEVSLDPEDSSRSYPDQILYLTQRLAETEQTLQLLLREQAGASPEAPPGSSDFGTVKRQRLQSSLNELEVVEEELRQHIEELTVANEELASTREAVDSERRRYQDLFDFAPDGYLVTDVDGVIREANQAIAVLLNQPRRFLVGKPFVLYVAQQDREAFRSGLVQLNRSPQNKKIQDWEIRLQSRKGEVFYSSLTVAKASTAAGVQAGLRWLVRDISSRKQAEFELHKARAELETRVEQRTHELSTANSILQSVMENTGTQLAYLDPDFNFLQINSAYAAGSGYSKDTIIGRNHFELFPNAENQAIFEYVRESGKPIEFHAKPFDFPGQPDRGATFWDWSLIPVRDRNERLQGFVLSLLEVTRSVFAEQALRKNQEELELRVGQRTRELQQANAELQEGLAELKRVEEQLRLQTTAVEAAANGIIITSRDGTIRWCNPAFLEMTGFKLEEIIGQNPRILNSGQHPADFHRQLWQTILSGKVWRGETINRRKDGSLYIEEQTITPLVDERGEISNFIAIKQDISERKNAEALIRQSAARTETLAVISQALVGASLDYHAILDIVSRTIADRIGDTCTVWSFSQDEHRLAPVAHWSKKGDGHDHIQDLSAFMMNCTSAKKSKAVFEINRPVLISSDSASAGSSELEQELSLRLASRGLSSLLIVPMALQGKVIGALSIYRNAGGRPYDSDDQLLLQSLADRIALALANARQLEEIHRLYQSEVGQHKLAEALVQAASALNASLNLDEVLDLILDQALLVIPAYGVNLMFLNGEYAYFVRFRGYQDPRRPFPDFSSSQIPLTIFQKEMIRTGQPILLKDTSQKPEWVSYPGMEWLRSCMGVPLRSDNQTIGFLNMDSDSADYFNQESLQRLLALSEHAALAIHNARLYENLKTSLKHEQAMRNQLIQAEKFSAMGRMIASVAHELNNPLQTIKNCLFLVQQELTTGFAVHEYLNIATTETQRISNLVLQLREVYRPREIYRMIPVELGKLVQEIHTLIAPHLQSQRVGWQVEPVPEPLYVNCIPDQLKQVYLNICVNAIEAMQPGGGKIFVTLLRDQNSMRAGVSFRDIGPGIPEENLSQIFDPFFTTKENGTGLGLPISYEIIRHHGGEILVKSKLGEGAEFSIWLPLLKSLEEVG